MRVQCPNCDAGIDLTELTDDIIRCPHCQFRFRPRAKRKSFPVVPVAIGAVAFLALAGGVVALVVTRDSKPKETAANPKPEEKPPPAEVPLPPAIAELFQDTADRATPAALVPILRPAGRDDFLVPPGFAELKADAAAKAAGKMDLEDIKKACVYVKVAVGIAQGTGSGFVIRVEKEQGTVLVATNEHVIARAAFPPPGSPPGKVSVVFDSGLPTEQERPAEVLAADPFADLAVLRVAGVTRMPEPIDPAFTPPVRETMKVLICGFPFGAGISRVGGNPAITLGPGQVSSLRRDKAGRLREVQINGAINPGNSGGPVVDEDGRLIGIAVATISGSGIGFAVPVARLQSILDGCVLPPVFIPGGVENEEAVFQVVVPVLDPFARVKGVTLYARAGGDGVPAAEKDPATGYKPLPGVTTTELKVEKDKATGTVRLPAKGAAPGKAAPVVLQLGYTADGAEAISAPVAHRLTLDEAPADAVPLDTLDRFPDKYAGQVVVVRGRLNPVSAPRWSVFEVDPVNDNGAVSVNLQFLITGEMLTQIRELPTATQLLPVRLTCRVGKKGPEPSVAVRITRIDFVGRNNWVAATVPAPDGPTEPLVALNRTPGRMAGQTLECKAVLTAGVILLPGQPYGQLIGLRLPDGRPATNLAFLCSADLATQVHQQGIPPGVGHNVRVSLRVEKDSTNRQHAVIVTKIVLLDGSGTPYKTLE